MIEWENQEILIEIKNAEVYSAFFLGSNTDMMY